MHKKKLQIAASTIMVDDYTKSKSISTRVSDTLYDIILLIGLAIVLLFVSNFILHRYFKFHLLTENWYVLSNKAPGWIVYDLPKHVIEHVM